MSQPEPKPPHPNPQSLEFQIEGFSAPLAAAMVPLKAAPGAAASAPAGGGGDEGAAVTQPWPEGPVVAVAMVADEGLVGTPKGLVLQW